MLPLIYLDFCHKLHLGDLYSDKVTKLRLNYIVLCDFGSTHAVGVRYWVHVMNIAIPEPALKNTCIQTRGG